jgi:hypothetical protein
VVCASLSLDAFFESSLKSGVLTRVSHGAVKKRLGANTKVGEANDPHERAERQ